MERKGQEEPRGFNDRLLNTVLHMREEAGGYDIAGNGEEKVVKTCSSNTHVRGIGGYIHAWREEQRESTHYRAIALRFTSRMWT